MPESEEPVKGVTPTVTIQGLQPDDVRLLDCFLLLDTVEQGRLLKSATVAACVADEEKRAARVDEVISETPEDVVLRRLWECMPEFPMGRWQSDGDFNSLLEKEVALRLRSRPAHTLDYVLTTSLHDAANASTLASWFNEFANLYGPDHCAPCVEDGYMDAQAMRQFIESWRDAFMARLNAE